MIGIWFLTLLAGASAPGADSLSSPVAGPPAPAVSDSVYTLPEVRVERRRALSEARRRLPTAFVTEVQTGARGRALETLSEALSEAAGVHVQQYGGLGSFSTVSLRGASSGQVTVYLDGVPLTSAAHGVVNLADLPATAIERVEVYRGLAPLGMGVATPGGAINLVTGSSASARDLRIAWGSFDTWEGRGTAGVSRGRLSALAHAGYQGSAGGFRFPNDNGTPLDPADDRVSARANNRFDAATAIASLAWEPRPGLRLLAREDLFHKAQGVPGLGSAPALNPRLAFLRSLSHAQIALDGAGIRPTARVLAASDRERTQFRDTEGKLLLGRHDSDDRVRSDEVSIGLEWARLGPVSVQGGGSVRGERANPSDAADGLPDPPQSRRTALGATVGLQVSPWRERLLIHAARRWDRLRDRLVTVSPLGMQGRSDLSRELDSPQIGVRLTVLGGIELRANWSRAERAPGFLELFGNLGGVLGNPLLQPERAENRDAGLSCTRSLGGSWSAAAEWAHFRSDAHDLVIYRRVSPSAARAENVASAKIEGEELTARLGAPDGFSASGSLTLQSAVDDGPVPAWHGKRLPQRPGRQAYARLDWRGGALAAGADLQYIGDNYLDPSNRMRVPSRTLVGATLSLTPFATGLTFTVEGKNLGDSHVSDVGGYPLPGRSLFVSCDLHGAASRH